VKQQVGGQKKAGRVLWHPAQAEVRLEWGTQPSLPVKKAGYSSLNLPQASLGTGILLCKQICHPDRSEA
jgi:hypothetical protein